MFVGGVTGADAFVGLVTSGDQLSGFVCHGVGTSVADLFDCAAANASELMRLENQGWVRRRAIGACAPGRVLDASNWVRCSRVDYTGLRHLPATGYLP
jgi:hypothetical protein